MNPPLNQRQQPAGRPLRMRLRPIVPAVGLAFLLLTGCAETLPTVIQPVPAATPASPTALGSVTPAAAAAPAETTPGWFASPVSAAVQAAAVAAEVDSVLLSVIVAPNPNPGDRAVFRFSAAKPLSSASVTIYTLVGERVRFLQDQAPSPVGVGAEALAYDVVFDGRNERGREVASGVYFCALEVISGGFRIRPRPLKLAIVRGIPVRDETDGRAPGEAEPAPAESGPWSADPREVAAYQRLTALLATLALADGPPDDPVMAIIEEQAREHLERLRAGFGGTHAAGEAELAMAAWLIADGRTEAARPHLERAAGAGYADLQARAALLNELSR